MKGRYDAIIIGGGPAGAVSGLLLARAGLRVCILEKTTHPRFHIGESILPRNFPLIQELGLEDVVMSLPHLPKSGAEFGFGNDFKTMRFGFMDGLVPGSPTFNIERAAFDKALLDRARNAGAEVFQETTVRKIASLAENDVKVVAGDQEYSGRMLLDCSGQGAVVGRHLGTRRAYYDPQLQKVAYFQHFHNVERLPGEANGHPAIMMCSEGWFWMIGLTETKSSVGFVARPTFAKEIDVPADRLLQWAIARCPVVRHRMRNAVGPDINEVQADFSYTCRPFAGPGYFLVGDAGCFLDPIFSTGVTLAMISATQAAKQTVEILAGRKAPSKARREYGRFIDDSTSIFWRLIRDYYRHSFRELFMEGQGPLQVHKAVISILAGQVFPKPVWALRWRLWFYHLCVRVQKYFAIVPRRAEFSLLSETPAPTLLSRLKQYAKDCPDAPAYEFAGKTLTFSQLAQRVAALARALPAGATIILCCQNQLDYPIAFLGILAAGCTLFPMSSESAEGELKRAATESSATGVIGDERAIAILGAQMQFACSIDQLPNADGMSLPDSIAGDLLLQSSGTMGVPKIVRRTGKSLNAVAAAMVEAIGFTATDRVLMTIPLTHSYGLEHGILAPIWAGSCVCLRALTDDYQDDISILPGVPSTFEMLAANATTAISLRLAYSAGAPLPESVFDSFKARFGVRVTQLFGATEIGSVTYNSPQDPFDPASVGRPMNGVSIRILSDDQIAIRAPSMFQEYISGETQLIDGHFLTGDVGNVDETGRLFITGRLKLLIDVGGFKVNPLEVESVLIQHPSVGSCVVVPVTQSATVRRLKAVIIPRNPTTSISIDELREHARQHLSAYKIPRFFEIRDSLPKSATGKVLRHLVEAS